MHGMLPCLVTRREHGDHCQKLQGCSGPIVASQGHCLVMHSRAAFQSQVRAQTAGVLWQVCTVFAQLTIGGKWEGPHVFVVRLRDDSDKLIPGVRIRDNGPKAGLNGVDNGQIW